MYRWKTTALVKATDPDITSVFMLCDLNQLVQLVVPTASLWPGFVLLQQRATGKAQKE